MAAHNLILRKLRNFELHLILPIGFIAARLARGLLNMTGALVW
jgi:hypothetical protein